MSFRLERKYFVTSDKISHTISVNFDVRGLLRMIAEYIIIIVVIIITYVLQLSCHSVAVVLKLVLTKQIGINIHKRNNTKTWYRQHKTQ